MKNIKTTHNVFRYANTILTIVTVAMMSFITLSCNNDWTEEQYTRYISFRSPLNSEGVTNIYVPFTRKNTQAGANNNTGISSYNLPVIVSGSTNNNNNIAVHVYHDADTLATENYARFQNRNDLWYKDMSEYTSFPETITIKAGENVELLPIKFNFNGIDMAKKWVLPIGIEEKADYGYKKHPVKNYAKALLRIFPFNDYSGEYSGTAMRIYSSDDLPLQRPKAIFVAML